MIILLTLIFFLDVASYCPRGQLWSYFKRAHYSYVLHSTPSNAPIEEFTLSSKPYNDKRKTIYSSDDGSNAFDRSDLTSGGKSMTYDEKETRDSIHSYVQDLRASKEYSALYRRKVLRKILNMLCDSAELNLTEALALTALQETEREAETKVIRDSFIVHPDTTFTPYVPKREVPLNYKLLSFLDHSECCTLVMAMVNARPSEEEVILLSRALRLADKWTSELLYIAVKSAVKRTVPHLGYAVLREAITLTSTEGVVANLEHPIELPSSTSDEEDHTQMITPDEDEALDEDEDTGFGIGLSLKRGRDGITGNTTRVTLTQTKQQAILSKGYVDVLTLPDNSDLSFIDGMFEFREANGVYVGQVKKGVKTGQGSYLFQNGDRFEGSFHDDDICKGKYVSTNGNCYDGQIRNGKLNGKGTFYWADGDIYSGSFVDSVRTGFGVYMNNRAGERYVGEYYLDMRHGQGTQTYRNGEVYEGMYYKDKMSGMGRYTEADGSMYSGEFRENAFHGVGQFFDAKNSTLYCGEFVSGDRHGLGTLLRVEKSRYYAYIEEKETLHAQESNNSRNSTLTGRDQDKVAALGEALLEGIWNLNVYKGVNKGFKTLPSKGATGDLSAMVPIEEVLSRLQQQARENNISIATQVDRAAIMKIIESKSDAGNNTINHNDKCEEKTQSSIKETEKSEPVDVDSSVPPIPVVNIKEKTLSLTTNAGSDGGMHVNVVSASPTPLLHSNKQHVMLDIFIVDELIDELSYAGYLDKALSLLSMLSLRQIGTRSQPLVPSMASYSTVCISAGRLQQEAAMMEVVEYLAMEAKRGVSLYNEPLFMSTLAICATNGYYLSAQKILKAYKEVYEMPDQRAYSLLLVSFISAFTTRSGTPEQVDQVDRDITKIPPSDYHEISKVVTFLIESNLDCTSAPGSYSASTSSGSSIRGSGNTPAVSSNIRPVNPLPSVILQFYSLTSQYKAAKAYFARIKTQVRKLPSNSALMAYADCLRRQQDWYYANELVRFMEDNGMIAYPHLRKFVNSHMKTRTLGDRAVDVQRKRTKESGGVASSGPEIGSDSDENVPGLYEDTNDRGTDSDDGDTRDLSHPLLSTDASTATYYMSPLLSKYQDPLFVSRLSSRGKEAAFKSLNLIRNRASQWLPYALYLQREVLGIAEYDYSYTVPSDVDMMLLDELLKKYHRNRRYNLTDSSITLAQAGEAMQASEGVIKPGDLKFPRAMMDRSRRQMYHLLSYVLDLVQQGGDVQVTHSSDNHDGACGSHTSTVSSSRPDTTLHGRGIPDTPDRPVLNISNVLIYEDVVDILLTVFHNSHYQVYAHDNQMFSKALSIMSSLGQHRPSLVNMTRGGILSEMLPSTILFTPSNKVRSGPPVIDTPERTTETEEEQWLHIRSQLYAQLIEALLMKDHGVALPSRNSTLSYLYRNMTSDALRAALGGDSPSMVEGGYRPGNRYEEDLGSRPRPKKEKDNKNKMDLIAKTLSIDPYMHSLGAMDIGEREREVLFRLYYAYAPVLDRMINSRSGLDIREGHPPCLKDLDILIDSIHDNTTASLSGTAFYRGLSYLTNSIRRLSVPLVTRVYQVMELASEEDPRILERFPAQLCSKIFKVLLYQGQLRGSLMGIQGSLSSFYVKNRHHRTTRKDNIVIPPIRRSGAPRSVSTLSSIIAEPSYAENDGAPSYAENDGAPSYAENDGDLFAQGAGGLHDKNWMTTGNETKERQVENGKARETTKSTYQQFLQIAKWSMAAFSREEQCSKTEKVFVRLLRMFFNRRDSKVYLATYALGTVSDLLELIAWVEQECGVKRQDWSENIHSYLISYLLQEADGFEHKPGCVPLHNETDKTQKGSASIAMQYFYSVEPSLQESTIYEEVIDRLLALQDVHEALKVIALLEKKYGLVNIEEKLVPGATITTPGTATSDSESSDAKDTSPAPTVNLDLDSIINQELSSQSVTSSRSISTRGGDTDTTATTSSSDLMGASPLRHLYSTLYSKVLNTYRLTAQTDDMKQLLRIMSMRGLAPDPGLAASVMDTELRGKNVENALEVYDRFFQPISGILGGDESDGNDRNSKRTEEPPDARAVQSLAKALLMFCRPKAESGAPLTPSQDLKKEVVSEMGPAGKHQKGELDMGRLRRAVPYIVNIAYHSDAIVNQFRTPVSMYGSFARLARLAADAGDMQTAVTIYSKIKLNERRVTPFVILSRQCTDRGQMDLVAQMLRYDPFSDRLVFHRPGSVPYSSPLYTLNHKRKVLHVPIEVLGHLIRGLCHPRIAATMQVLPMVDSLVEIIAATTKILIEREARSDSMVDSDSIGNGRSTTLKDESKAIQLNASRNGTSGGTGGSGTNSGRYRSRYVPLWPFSFLLYASAYSKSNTPMTDLCAVTPDPSALMLHYKLQQSIGGNIVEEAGSGGNDTIAEVNVMGSDLCTLYGYSESDVNFLLYSAIMDVPKEHSEANDSAGKDCNARLFLDQLIRRVRQLRIPVHPRNYALLLNLQASHQPISFTPDGVSQLVVTEELSRDACKHPWAAPPHMAIRQHLGAQYLDAPDDCPRENSFVSSAISSDESKGVMGEKKGAMGEEFVLGSTRDVISKRHFSFDCEEYIGVVSSESTTLESSDIDMLREWHYAPKMEDIPTPEGVGGTRSTGGDDDSSDGSGDKDGKDNDSMNTVSTGDGIRITNTERERVQRINNILTASIEEWKLFMTKDATPITTIRPRSSLRNNQKLNIVKNLKQQERNKLLQKERE